MYSSYGASAPPLSPFHARSRNATPIRQSTRATPERRAFSPLGKDTASGNEQRQQHSEPSTPFHNRGFSRLRDSSPMGSPHPSWGPPSPQSPKARDEPRFATLSRSTSSPRRKEPSYPPSTPSKPVVAAAAESPSRKSETRGTPPPQSPLRWEHPALPEVAQQLTRRGFGDVDHRKLAWNCWAVFGLGAAYVSGWYSSIQTVASRFVAPNIVQAAFIGYAVVTALNIVYLLVKYFKPSPLFADYGLTPEQRKLFGLDPSTPARQSGGKYADIKKPQFDVATSRSKKNDQHQASQGDRSDTYQDANSSPYSGTPYSPKQHERTPRGLVSTPVSPLAKYMLATSPAHMHEEPIRDRYALEAMLNRSNPESNDQKQAEDASGNYYGFDSPGRAPMSPFVNNGPEIPRFKGASKISMPAKVQERIEDGVVIKEPQKTLEDWRIANYIDDWTEKMRSWLAAKVVKPLAKRITQCDDKFASAQMKHLSCAAATMQEGLLAANRAAMDANTASITQNTSSQGFGFSMFGAKPAGPAAPATGQTPQTLYELSQRFKTEAMVQERLKLENHLTVPGWNCRDYIVERIKRLTEKLTDHFSKLIVHMFCRYLDELMPGGNFAIYEFFPFSKDYFIPLEKKPEDSRSKNVQIRHYTKWPPHYHDVVEGTVYDIYSGRNNAFQTLCLFAYYIKTEAAGYIGNLHVGGKTIELTSVVEHGPSMGRRSWFEANK
ncbi:hypothetical protein HKX48_003910 [Thoreauomyces humboldtii]|nr:hypothetical protein HKX48_003910 [Thoreauomyces humboldtii]